MVPKLLKFEDFRGLWSLRGNSICYEYSQINRFDEKGFVSYEVPQQCANVFISTGGIEFIAQGGIGKSIVEKIENVEFDYDFSTGFTFADEAVLNATASTGTGFFVSSSGHVVTNKHVVENCRSIVLSAQGETRTAELLIVSPTTDLALLRAPISGQSPVLIRSQRPRLGEEITVAGFPLVGILASDLKITGGQVNSQVDGSGVMQISAPIQPGNSGSPVYDEYGLVVGVVFSKLDEAYYERSIGGSAQNVNFAVSAQELERFLQSADISVERGNPLLPMRRDEIANSALKSTVLIRCS